MYKCNASCDLVSVGVNYLQDKKVKNKEKTFDSNNHSTNRTKTRDQLDVSTVFFFVYTRGAP